jgi:hypothetical protein
MNEEEKSFIRQVFGSIASPKHSFDSIQTEDLSKGVTIIIIIAAISALAGYTYASKMPITMPGGLSQRRGFGPPGANIDPQTLRNNLMSLYALQNMLKVITGWMFPAIFSHTIATVLVGRGSFRRMLALLGFAHIPLLFQQVARVIDASIISEDILASVISNRLFEQGLGSIFLTNFFAEFNVFGIWRVALSVIVASKNYHSPYRKAFAIVMSSYVLMVLFRSFLLL